MQLMNRVLVLAVVLLTAVPALAQNKRGEHWVSTWATSLVTRPVPQAAPATAPAAPTGPAPAAPGGGRGGFAPPTNLMNQTIRQIVHTSIGGNRVRVVLSNAFGTSPIDV